MPVPGQQGKVAVSWGGKINEDSRIINYGCMNWSRNWQKSRMCATDVLTVAKSWPRENGIGCGMSSASGYGNVTMSGDAQSTAGKHVKNPIERR